MENGVIYNKIKQKKIVADLELALLFIFSEKSKTPFVNISARLSIPKYNLRNTKHSKRFLELLR